MANLVDVEAEMAVIGCVLLDDGDNVGAFGAARHLPTDAFTDDRNRQLWASLQTCTNRHDLIVVRDHLGDAIESCGGQKHLFDCCETVGAVNRVAEYVGVVWQAYQRRCLGDALSSATDAVANVSDPSDAIEALRSSLDRFQTKQYGQRIVTVNASAVEPEAIVWLWPNRIPQGKLTLLAGHGGLGKSFVTIDVASRVSRGIAWPDGSPNREAGNVVIMNAEDGPSDTIVPRLVAAQADTSRIEIVTGLKDDRGRDGWVNLGAHLQEIERVIVDKRATLLIVDPITAYLGKVDDHRNSELRAVLGPLAALAERHRVAVIAVTHFRKGQGLDAAQQIIGSVAYTAAARMCWVIGRDPDDDTRRLMLQAKNNITTEQAGLAFRIIDGVVQWSADAVNTTADAMIAATQQGHEAKTAQSEAVEFLRDVLALGRVESHEIKKLAARQGISERTLWRAKAAIGVETVREGFGKSMVTYWGLPQSVPQEHSPCQSNLLAETGNDGTDCDHLSAWSA